jgi:glycerophosphoryl diester phosphodiesterase
MRSILLLGLLLSACATAPSPPEASPRPLVIAHRGACAERPEHTLEAYRLAIEQGADFIEIDIVATGDGHLIARHENELSRSTDIETRPRFADRRTTKVVEGSEISGWFSEDLSLAEIKQLRAVERIPDVRPESARHDGRYAVATLEEIIDLLRDVEVETGRRVGLDVEIKYSTWFAREGTHLSGEHIGLSLPHLLVETLVAQDFTDPEQIFIQAFEVEPLLDLQLEILPAAGLDLPLLQLLGNLGDPREPFQAPYDFRYNAREGRKPYGALASCLETPIESAGYAQLVSPTGLRCMRRLYAEGIAVRKENVLLRAARRAPLDTAASVRTQQSGDVAEWIEDARDAGLLVHYWTLRAEERFRSLRPDGQLLSFEEEAAALLALGANGLITDHPQQAVAARDAFLDTAK